MGAMSVVLPVTASTCLSDHKNRPHDSIVEQNPANVRNFGQEMLQNTYNIVSIPGGKGSLHAKISGYYSSIQPFSEGKTVRQWLSTKSFEEQYEFGIEKLKMFGW